MTGCPSCDHCSSGLGDGRWPDPNLAEAIPAIVFARSALDVSGLSPFTVVVEASAGQRSGKREPRK